MVGSNCIQRGAVTDQNFRKTEKKWVRGPLGWRRTRSGAGVRPGAPDKIFSKFYWRLSGAAGVRHCRTKFYQKPTGKCPALPTPASDEKYFQHTGDCPAPPESPPAPILKIMSTYWRLSGTAGGGAGIRKKSFQRTGNCPAPPAGVSGDAGADVRRVNKKIEYYRRLSGAGQPSGD